MLPPATAGTGKDDENKQKIRHQNIAVHRNAVTDRCQIAKLAALPEIADKRNHGKQQIADKK